MRLWLLTLAIAYLLGSIPFGYLLVRIFRKEDIRATGSGNIGATNVARSGAKGLGILTLLFDLLKGYAAVEIAAHFAPGTPGFPSDLAVAAGVAAGVVIGGAFATPGIYNVPAPSPADDPVAYCTWMYSSYDPQSGTYIGDDGNLHPCP